MNYLKIIKLNIDERSIKGSLPLFRHIDEVSKRYYDVIIGAGHKTYPFLVNIKKYQKKHTKKYSNTNSYFQKIRF
jgi:hypothetical protein